MSARDTVLDNLETALEGITEANGYYTTVKKVERGPVPTDEIANNVPFIAIIEADEIPHVIDDVNARFAATIGLMLFLQGRSATTLSEQINEFADDVKKLIYSPVSLSDYGLDANILRSDVNVDIESNMASCTMEVEIIYYATQATF